MTTQEYAVVCLLIDKMFSSQKDEKKKEKLKKELETLVEDNSVCVGKIIKR